MKRPLRWAIRMYPAAWRARYQRELEALVEDAGIDWRGVMDLLRGGLTMRMTMWTPGRALALCVFVGALAGLGFPFTWPRRYVSEGTLALSAAISRTAVIDAAQRALSRNSLHEVIRREKLYETELARSPAENVIDRMRGDIRIAALDARTVRISFRHADPARAQAGSRELMRRLAAESGLAVVDRASLPNAPVRLNWVSMLVCGVAAGALAGSALALVRRRSRA